MDPFARHDHARCIATARSAAEAACAATGARLTPLRRRVLDILLAEHKAQGAYDVLARLSAEGLGSTPPTAYRALEFLVSHGLAHRIEGRNAYVACARPGAPHVPAFLICTACGEVAEAAVDEAPLTDAAAAAGFAIERAVLEAEGLCPACRAEGAGA